MVDYFNTVISFAENKGITLDEMTCKNRKSQNAIEMSMFCLTLLTQRYRNISKLAQRFGCGRCTIYNRLDLHYDQMLSDGDYKDRYLNLYLEFMTFGGRANTKNLTMMVKIIELMLYKYKGEQINDSLIEKITKQLKELI